ncbi:DUF2314 domain-containing protein [Chitinophaga silvisoli]|uniref:DUF2314 domain-containing protein n=1 Tax=Chitinophaga silvisoli TaxID=2291814 RepID=A0A3E1NUK3_9BACT|nr:DUF2314 domain-containing protein [Chitinophaga silvisoli]RFM31583.1 DUF2314 domain-containing protein [Chitinophaga silvisoli]
MSNEKIFYVKGDSPAMMAAYKKAQNTFKYFWRELSWEYRRIVPALNVACVKAVFMQETGPDTEPITENMWINNVGFDGEYIYGVLVNTPNELTNIQNGAEVKLSLDQISDWLFVNQDLTYGGFTIHAIRSQMSEEERNDHDAAWGLDFGDYNDILIVYQEKEHPENLIEHPMSKNMRQKVAEHLQQDPAIINAVDENGYTLLHKEAIAGNRTLIEELLAAGADTSLKTNNGKTALDFAKALNWEHIIPLLEK